MWWVNERNRRWSKKITARGLRGTGVGRPPPSPLWLMPDALVWCGFTAERELTDNWFYIKWSFGIQEEQILTEKPKLGHMKRSGWTLMPRAHCKYRVELGVIRILSYGSLRHLIFTPYPRLFPFSLPTLRQLVLEPCSLWLWRSLQDTGPQPCITTSILEFSR